MASMYGGLLGGINQTNKTLTSILTISDGFTTMSGGNISGAQNISTSNLTITNDLICPEVITSSIISPTGTLSIGSTLNVSNIQTSSGLLYMGSQFDDIQIVGANIRLIGNVVGYDSANVYIVDKAIDLNASGFGNATLDGAGINVLGDGNIVISSLLTNNVGDWIFSNPNNNKVVIGNLEVANLSVTNPIVYDNFQASNITATNKFFSPERIITDRGVHRSSSISHLNAGDIRCSRMNSPNITGDLISCNTLNCNQISFLNQPGLRIEHGVTPTVNTSTVITFTTPFNSEPTVLVSGFRNSATPPITYLRGLTTTTVNLYAKNDAGSDYGSLQFTWIAIGY